MPYINNQNLHNKSTQIIKNNISIIIRIDFDSLSCYNKKTKKAY